MPVLNRHPTKSAVKQPIPLKKIIHSGNQNLRRLTGSIHQIKQLNKRLARILPANTCQHCQISSVSEDSLIVHCESAAWATRIRFEQAKIIKTFKDLGIKSISIHIHQAKAPHEPTKSVKNLSSKAAESLTQLAEGTTDHKLKSALQRLAKRANKNESV